MDKTFDRFLGLNNRLAANALRTKEGSFVNVAENVDFDGAGQIRLRDGFSVAQAMTNGHSFWSDGSRHYLVRASVLYSVTLPTYTETLLKVLTSDDPMYYVMHDESLYFSNGTDSGRLSSADAYYPWGMPTPDAPSCANTTGTLDIGGYQVAVSYYNNVTGEESGLSSSTLHSLASAGAIRVTLPSATTGATHVRIYVSQLNGGVVGLHGAVATGTATYDVTTTTTTSTGDAVYVEPLPACTQLFTHLGRLCGVVGGKVVYSEPYRLGYYRPLAGYISFPSDVSVAVSTKFGVFVAADMTRYFAGSLHSPDAVTDVLPYGAVPASSFIYPHNSKVGWMGEKGFVEGAPSGEVEAVMTETVDATLPTTVSPAYVNSEDGFRRVYCAGYTMNLDTKAVSTYTNYDFSSMSGGYGAKADGLYALTGAKDGIVDITSTVGLGTISFTTEAMKHLPNLYLGCSSETQLMLRVGTEQGEYDYLARAASDILKVQRVDIGKGLRSNWFTLSLYNTEGSYFLLTSATFEPTASSRRI